MSEPQPHLLLVEDDPNLGQLLQEYLTLKGYHTDLATDGAEGLNLFEAGRYDLCLLDVMLPKKDGFSLARDIRQRNSQVPIIFLTAKSLKEDTLEGLRLGADDYITKPFSMEELLLRIGAVLRRWRGGPDEGAEATEFRIGRYSFDSQQQILKDENGSIRLTTREAGLLRLLCLNMNGTLERSFALKQLWGDDTYFNARSMDVYITKLRKYLRADPSVEIMNVHGTGYKLLVLRSLDITG